MSVKTVAIVLGVMTIAGPALADCKDDLRELNVKIAQFKAQAPIGGELRKLRSAAITFDRLGRGDACEETVSNIKSLIEDRKERREERREERLEAQKEMERYTQAVAVGNLPGIVRASTVQGLDVVNMKGEELGVIEDVAIDSKSGKIAYVVMSHGGFIGIGEKHLPVPWSSFKVTKDREDLVLAVSKAKLEKAPSFNWDAWPNMEDNAWRIRIDGYYDEAM